MQVLKVFPDAVEKIHWGWSNTFMALARNQGHGLYDQSNQVIRPTLFSSSHRTVDPDGLPRGKETAPRKHQERERFETTCAVDEARRSARQK
jgi:hypothetical protein